MKLKNDESADVRSDVATQVIGLFFVAIIVLAFTTNPVQTGTKEGQRAPALEGMAYNGSGWSEFNMGDWIDPFWTPGNASGEWLVVEFMDTDCPFCIESAVMLGQYANYFQKLDPAPGQEDAWDGPMVNFLASATELNIEGHETSRGEIMAFRDLTSGETCNGRDCGSREGGSHSFTYIDDIDQDNMKKWGIAGTPTYFIIQPDGIVSWVSSENQGEELQNAIYRILTESE